MKRGFTLVELLAVILIITVILLILTPKIIETIHTSKLKVYDEQISRIEEAANLYITDDNNAVTFIDDQEVLTLQQLIDGGYIEAPVVNPKTNQNFNTTTTIVTVIKVGETYQFVVTVN